MRSTPLARMTSRGRRASGSPAARALARAGLTARGLVWVLIGCVAALVAFGQARQEASQQGALQLLARQPLGSVLLWVLGILKYLRTSQVSLSTRRVIEALGVIGTIARGVVVALAGALVIEAAVTHQASESGGIDTALITLRNQPLGEILVLLAALGLIVFGGYGLCEARWRRV